MITHAPDEGGAPICAESGNASGPPPTKSSTLHYMLFGAEGLRAGWGIVLFYGLYRALLRCLYPPALALLHTQRIKGDPIGARQTLVFEGVGIAALLSATWLLARLERRRIGTYGLARRHRGRHFAGGLMWGVALLSLLVALLRMCGLLVFDVRLLTGAAMLRYGLLWLAAFLSVGAREELYSRGYLQFTLTRGLRAVYRWLFGERHANALGFWTAAMALSYLFGAGHGGNPDESPLGMLSAGLAGLVFCLSLWRTGSLWWAIGFHTSWDWAQSFLYGVPDSGLLVRGHFLATHAIGRPWLSGGVTGPEGSILFLPIALIAAGAVVLTLPGTHRGYLRTDAEDGVAEVDARDGGVILP